MKHDDKNAEQVSRKIHELEQQLAEQSVTKIMIDVVPGHDGMGGSYTIWSIHVKAALDIQPIANLLAEQDRKRDAKLLLAFGETSMADSVTLNSLKCYAAARIAGSWVPEL